MYCIRALQLEDLKKGYLSLLSQLTSVSEINGKMVFDELMKCGNVFIFVIEDLGKIIASGTIIIERKFIHGGAAVGHIEDIIVHNTYRGKGLGRLMVEYLIDFSKNAGCYKVLLNCEEKNRGFYEKMGLSCKNVEMSLYFG